MPLDGMTDLNSHLKLPGLANDCPSEEAEYHCIE